MLDKLRLCFSCPVPRAVGRPSAATGPAGLTKAGVALTALARIEPGVFDLLAVGGGLDLGITISRCARRGWHRTSVE